MKKMIIAFTMLASLSAMAHDSLWSLCRTKTVIYGDEETLILNEYEHRNSKGDGRDTDLKLIFGGNLLAGVFNSTEVSIGPLSLKSKASSFDGIVKLSDDSVELNGILNLNGSKTILKAKFDCEVLRD